MTIHLTSDTHLGHTKIIEYCSRPFSSVEEMDEAIIDNWNRQVKPTDTVYHLGDFCWHKGGDSAAIEYLRKLNGKKILVAGNHDNKLTTKDGTLRNPYQNYFEFATSLLDTVVNGQPITMCHYAMRVWNKSHYNAWHVYGHSHGNLPPIGKSWDIGVDTNHFRPISWDELEALMATRPDNVNALSRKEKR